MSRVRGRGGALLLSLLMALLVSVSLIGCEQSTELDEQAIQEAAHQELEAYEPTSELEQHLFGHLDVEWGDVVVEGDEAFLDVKVTNANLPKAVEEAYKEMSEGEELDTLAELYDAGVDEDMYAEVMDVIYRHMDECKDMVSSDVRLRYTREGNTWTLDETSAQEFATASYAGLQ